MPFGYGKGSVCFAKLFSLVKQWKSEIRPLNPIVYGVTAYLNRKEDVALALGVRQSSWLPISDLIPSLRTMRGLLWMER